MACVGCKTAPTSFWRSQETSTVRTTQRFRFMYSAAVGNSTSAPAPGPGQVFIFGLGYTGLAMASFLQRKNGWKIAGTCRSEDKQAILQGSGIEAFCFDPDNLASLSNAGVASLQAATHVISTIPPNGDFNKDPVLIAHGGELQSMASRLQWAGYISSTGVYGDWQGAWVGESSELRGTSQSAVARIRAEEAWLALHKDTGLPTHVFRLGGIYGPGRSALDAARAKVCFKASPSSNQARRGLRRYTSRCHVHDVCRVLYASIQQSDPGGIYNVVDDDPASRGEVVEYARSLLGQPSPRGPSLSNEEPELVRRVDEKRVCNAKVKTAFGLDLHFPSYKEGLDAVHNGSMLPFR